MFRQQITIETQGRGFYEISAELKALTRQASLATGLCHVYLHHTSASMLIMENADPAVLRDMERFMSKLVIDGDPDFEHTDEGPDDMSAHVRTALTHTDLTIPINDGVLDLGVWQGVYVWEHRSAPHKRRMTVSVF